MKHTLGPWKLEVTHYHFIVPNVGLRWMRSHSTNEIEDQKIKSSNQGLQELADAVLIAAAPEMLEALEQAKIRLECAGLNDTTLDVIKAAITKATVSK